MRSQIACSGFRRKIFDDSTSGNGRSHQSSLESIATENYRPARAAIKATERMIMNSLCLVIDANELLYSANVEVHSM